MNKSVTVKSVRISSTGEQLGIMSAKDALKKAEEKNLDLVKIAPTAKPPVCKIMDYGKYRFEQAKREKKRAKTRKWLKSKRSVFLSTLIRMTFRRRSITLRNF